MFAGCCRDAGDDRRNGLLFSDVDIEKRVLPGEIARMLGVDQWLIIYRMGDRVVEIVRVVEV